MLTICCPSCSGEEEGVDRRPTHGTKSLKEARSVGVVTWEPMVECSCVFVEKAEEQLKNVSRDLNMVGMCAYNYVRVRKFVCV